VHRQSLAEEVRPDTNRRRPVGLEGGNSRRGEVAAEGTRSAASRTITAPASLVRRSGCASITTLASKLGMQVDGVSPMGGSALADVKAQLPESET